MDTKSLLLGEGVKGQLILPDVDLGVYDAHCVRCFPIACGIESDAYSCFDHGPGIFQWNLFEQLANPGT